MKFLTIELRDAVDTVLRLAREQGETFASVRLVGPDGTTESWFGKDPRKKRRRRKRR